VHLKVVMRKEVLVPKIHEGSSSHNPIKGIGDISFLSHHMYDYARKYKRINKGVSRTVK